MSLRKATLGIVLLAFSVTTPVAAAWCDAACAVSGNSSSHHGSERTTALPKVHHHDLAAGMGSQAPTSSLSGHDAKCAPPRSVVLASGKSTPTNTNHYARTVPGETIAESRVPVAGSVAASPSVRIQAHLANWPSESRSEFPCQLCHWPESRCPFTSSEPADIRASGAKFLSPIP